MISARNHLNPAQLDALEALSRQVASFVELRRKGLELKVRERELSEERERMSEILSHLQEAVWLRDYESHEIVFVNTSFETIWEKSTMTLAERPYSYVDNVHPDDREIVKQALALKRSGNYEFKYRIITESGILKWIHSRAFLIRDESGKISYIMDVSNDISAKVEQERLIEEQKGKVLQSARLASLGEMASGIAHEINTPLAVIRGTAQLLDRALSISAPESPIFNQHLATIEKTVVRIAKIISGLRAHARDGSKDEFVPTQVKDLVADAVELCQHRIRNKGIEFTVEMPENAQSIECRPVQIVQILGNLLNNAYDAISEQETRWIKLKVTENRNRNSFSSFRQWSGDPGKSSPETDAAILHYQRTWKRHGTGLKFISRNRRCTSW